MKISSNRAQLGDRCDGHAIQLFLIAWMRSHPRGARQRLAHCQWRTSAGSVAILLSVVSVVSSENHTCPNRRHNVSFATVSKHHHFESKTNTSSTPLTRHPDEKFYSDCHVFSRMLSRKDVVIDSKTHQPLS